MQGPTKQLKILKKKKDLIDLNSQFRPNLIWTPGIRSTDSEDGHVILTTYPLSADLVYKNMGGNSIVFNVPSSRKGAFAFAFYLGLEFGRQEELS